MTAAQKLKRYQERIVVTEICHKLHIQCVEFHSRSFRLNKNGKVIDIYTKSLKCFWHSTHEWGSVNNLESFIQFEFGSN